MTADQAEKHAMEMEQSVEEEKLTQPIIVHKLWKDYDVVDVPITRTGHGGGDKKLQDKIFRTPEMADPYKHSAGIRDGAMSMLIGVAARKSIEAGEKIRIAELTDLQPRVKRI